MGVLVIVRGSDPHVHVTFKLGDGISFALLGGSHGRTVAI
jgi:hypothetical protein